MITELAGRKRDGDRVGERGTITIRVTLDLVSVVAL
jgi:hypothetical protein